MVEILSFDSLILWEDLLDEIFERYFKKKSSKGILDGKLS